MGTRYAVTEEEVLDVLNEPSIDQPLSAGELAVRVWMARPGGTQQITDSHVRPLLNRMVEAGKLVRAVGHKARRMGRLWTIRQNASYYDLPERGNTRLRQAEMEQERRDQARELGDRIKCTYPSLIGRNSITGSGDLTLTLSIAQGEKLLAALNSSDHTEPTNDTQEDPTDG